MSAPTADRQGHRRLLADPRRDPPAHPAHRPVVAVAASIVDLGFAAFVIYATVRAFLQNNYYVAAVPLPDAVLLAVHQQGVRA